MGAAEPPAGNLQPRTVSSFSSLINTSEGVFLKSPHILFDKMAAASLSQLNPCWSSAPFHLEGPWLVRSQTTAARLFLTLRYWKWRWRGRRLRDVTGAGVKAADDDDDNDDN